MALFTTAEAVQMTGATAPQIDYFVRVSKIVAPAKPASRRGVSHGFDLKNLIEITVATELLNCGIEAREIDRALAILREHWSELSSKNPRGFANRERYAVLAVFGSGWQPGEVSRPTSIQIGPPAMLATFAAYVIHASVPLRWIVTRLEAMAHELL